MDALSNGKGAEDEDLSSVSGEMGEEAFLVGNGDCFLYELG